MLHHQILDVPNERSSHAAPTPHGAGAVMMIVIALCWLVLMIKHDVPFLHYGVLASAVGVAVLSWLDDQYHVPFIWRLAAHAAAAAIAILSLPPDIVILQPWLPLWLERILMGIGLVWFMNLFNFMDGIDGMMGTLMFTIALGIGILTPQWLDWQLALVIMPVALGFLIWNWAPAKIFSGDVGSVAIGYLIGWLLLRFAMNGLTVAAVILILYPALDTTWTLLRRMSQGEKFWVPHRRHFFQKAVRSGLSHGQVMLRVGILQGVMVMLAIFGSVGDNRVAAASMAILLVGGWLGYCQWRFRASLAAPSGPSDLPTPVLFAPESAAETPDEMSPSRE
jgi:UDP-N-acetylmuramyl pentapeptide phosphotransferase/UDP-N-acetylglucosamine-1-phosphate transferase